MSNENSHQPLEISTSAPEGAEVISEDPQSPEVLEPDLLHRVEEVARVAARTTIQRESYSGPMPPPKFFREYDATLPGTALIIRNEFEANGQHVRRMEEKALSASIENDYQNRKAAERLVWGSLAIIALMAYSGHDKVAIALAVTTVVAVITGFLKSGSEKKGDTKSSGDSTPD